LVKPWSEYVEVYWDHGLEAYITPCGEGMVGVATLWDRKRYPKVQGGRELVSTFIHQFTTLHEHLSGATPCGDFQAIGPLNRQVSSPITDGVLLIGDAAGYLDAITGEGIGLAVTQALALNHTVVPILKKKPAGILTTEDLRNFAEISKDNYTSYTRMTHLALFLSRHPKFAHFAIYLFGKYPRLFEHLLSKNMDSSVG
jgi:menaquinone-9 beta-reductase